MYKKALSIYYGLAMFVLATALFVFYPSSQPELTAWQGGVRHQVDIAWQQTIGDQPMFGEVAEVYDSVTAFYDQSATATIAMISSPSSDADIYFVFHQVYTDFAQAIHTGHTGDVAGANIVASVDLPAMPPDFMTQEPIYNLVPEPDDVPFAMNHVTGAVSGAMVTSGTPVNSTDEPWVTVQDNYTGQLYCLAVYDGTVNKYIGPCRNEYH